MKLKWYDWDGAGEIPQGVVGICHRDGSEDYDDTSWWIDGDWDLIGDDQDIIAYTLGEPLEGDKE